MRYITLQETADYLEVANIEKTINAMSSVVHFGISGDGIRFVLVNNCMGETVLDEAI